MISWIQGLSGLQIAELIGLYLSGIGAISAAVAAVWIATRQNRRRILISQTFNEGWDEQYRIPKSDQSAELLVTNASGLPLSIQSVFLSMPNKYALLEKGHYTEGKEFPIFLDVGRTEHIRFEQKGQSTWPISELLRDIESFPLWVTWLALRLSTYWRLRLVTGEIFRMRISAGLRDQVWLYAKSSKRGQA